MSKEFLKPVTEFNWTIFRVHCVVTCDTLLHFPSKNSLSRDQLSKNGANSMNVRTTFLKSRNQWMVPDENVAPFTD